MFLYNNVSAKRCRERKGGFYDPTWNVKTEHLWFLLSNFLFFDYFNFFSQKFK